MNGKAEHEKVYFMYPISLQISFLPNTLTRCVVCVHNWNGFVIEIESAENKPIISIAEYRELLKDYKSTDERIEGCINYIAGLARKNIQIEIKKYVEKRK